MSDYPLGLRNFQAEFESALLEAGLSTTHRPDAVSFDYLTAFGLGPRRITDVSAGITERPWRVRAVGNDILLARASDDGMSWVEESTLFTIEGDPPIELDLAFDQQGRPVVCVERETDGKHVWLYWFDPTAATFVFTDFGPGWTPRILMDDPIDTTESDIQLFYFREDFGLARREQRDRYAVEYATPINVWENRFLEDVGYIKWHRFAVLYTIRNPVSGRYTIGRLESLLYPHRAAEECGIAVAMQGGTLRIGAIHQMQPAESVELGVGFQDGAMFPLIILYDVPPESVEIDVAFEDGTLVSALIFHDDIAPEPVEIDVAFEDGLLHVFLIFHDAINSPESVEIEVDLEAGSLAVP